MEVAMEECELATNNNRKHDEQHFPVHVFCSGANENLSLGNPLGTSKRQRILFKPHSSFTPAEVIVGTATTIFIGQRGSSTIFVAGKFGDDHFMTPKLFKLDNKVLCAAVAPSHAIICCEGLVYCIGDNANNQLGVGSGRTHIAKLTSYESPVRSGRVVRCATSARHTVLLTDNGGLYVSGANYGQMGEYASRAFQPPNSSPKTFFPMLRSGDPLLTDAGVAISDTITIVYSRNRARIFYEYREYSLFFFRMDGSARIVRACVCRSAGTQTTFVLFFSAPDALLYLWQRHGSGKSLKPIWRLLDEELATINHKALSKAAETVACTHNGDFYINLNAYVLHGSVAVDADGRLQLTTRRIGGLPGFVRGVFASPNGKDLALIVAANAPADADQRQAELRRRHERTIARRFDLLQRVRSAPANDGCSGRLVRVESKTRHFFVHRFVLAVRTPFLLTPRWLKAGIINLRRVNDQTVSELLEFIYTGTSVTFRTLELGASGHMLCCLTNWACEFCGQRDPTIQFPLLNEICETEPSHSHGSLTSNTLSDSKCPNDRGSCSAYSFPCIMLSDDILECLESGLTRMNELARDLRWRELRRCIDAAADQLPEYISETIEDQHFADKFDLENAFVDEDDLISLQCDDGQRFSFPKELLLDSSYFQTLLRWHNETVSVRLEGISSEMLRVVLKFFFSRELDDQLSFEQIVELLFFADHYSFFDLEWAAAHLLEMELHMDNIEEVIELAKTLYLTQLIDTIVTFIVRHWTLFMESSGRRAIIISRMPDIVRSALIKRKDLETDLAALFAEAAESINDVNGVEHSVRSISAESFGKSPKKTEHTSDVLEDENHDQLQRNGESETLVTSDGDVDIELGNVTLDDASRDNIDAVAGIELVGNNTFDEPMIEPTVSTVVAGQSKSDFSPADEAAACDAAGPSTISKGRCWKVLPAVVAVPIAAQLEEASGFVASPAIQKHWKRHRNAEKKMSSRRSGRQPVIVELKENSSPKLNLLAWNNSPLGASPQPLTSLADIMRHEESLVQSSRVSETPTRSQQQPLIAKVSPGWGKSPVQSAVDEQSPTATVKSLHQIQTEEAAAYRMRAEADERRASKPLHCVAIEERAIRELKQYYESVYADGDVPAYFVVHREEESAGPVADHCMNFGRAVSAINASEQLQSTMQSMHIAHRLEPSKCRNSLSSSSLTAGRQRASSDAWQ